MITNLDSQTGTSLSITSEATVATYTTAADGEVSGRLNLSALNGAAAVITVKVQLLDSGSTKLGVPVAFSATKDAAADTTFSAVWGPIRVTSGQKLRVRASSTNSSDTGASWESKMDDAGASQVASATTADSKTLLTSGTGTGQVNPSSGKVTATLAATDVTGNVAADLQTIKTQAVTAAAGVTFPTSIASPTNITAGTIGTVTTLTNLPAVPTDWLTAAGVKADAVTKIQSGLATPTNITAGTITTVTNLTNAPTAGDFTAAMKTSLNAATPAVSVSAGGITAASIAANALNGKGDWNVTVPPSAAAIDAQLTGTHGSGAWGATVTVPSIETDTTDVRTG